MDPRGRMIKEIREKYSLNSPKVFSAMRNIHREKFLPKRLRHLAYKDNAIPIGSDQTMSQPYTVAFMTDLLDLKGNEKVLEIGTGSGYQAGVLSKLAKEVYSIERIKSLAENAQKTLKKLKINNVHVKWGKGEDGWEEASPFDAILVTARVSGGIPQALTNQLKDGGVIVAPIAETMMRFVKNKNKLSSSKHGSFRFVPFIED